jgi:hypothetical protein
VVTAPDADLVARVLDDTRSYKNWENARRLSGDPAYRLVTKSRWLRNGFAVFERA